MTTTNEEPNLVTAAEAAGRLGVKTRTFHMWRHRADRGGGPIPVPEPADHVGPIPRFDWEAILRWSGKTGHIRNAVTLQEYRDRFGEEPLPPRAGGTLPSNKPQRRRRGAFNPKRVV